MYKKILFLLFIIILSGCVEINLIKKTVINTEKVWLGSIDFSGYYNVEPIKNNPKLIWYFNNPPYPVPNTPFIYKPIFINSPLVYEGYVYFSDKDGNFYALDEKNGNLIWKVHFENSYEITTPTLANDIIFIGVCNLGIIGLNSKNGEIKFKLYNDDYFPAPPIIIDSMLYFLSIKPSWQHLNIYINAFNIEKSRYIYKRRFETNTKSPIFLISKESLVFYNEYIKSFLYNIDLKSGKIKWKKDIPNILNRTIPFDSNKIFIFTFNENLKLFTIDIDNGNILCSKDISNNIIEPQNVLLVTDKNNLYVGIDNLILIINKNDLNLIKKIEIDEKIGSFMILVKDVLYTNVIDKENRASLSGIDINTGKILWKLNYYFLSNYPPDVLDTSIYINGHSTIYKLSEEQN